MRNMKEAVKGTVLLPQYYSKHPSKSDTIPVSVRWRFFCCGFLISTNLRTPISFSAFSAFVMSQTPELLLKKKKKKEKTEEVLMFCLCDVYLGEMNIHYAYIKTS